MKIETLHLELRIEAPDPEGRRPHAKVASEALDAAADAAVDAVKQVKGITYVGIGYGIPRSLDWRPSRG